MDGTQRVGQKHVKKQLESDPNCSLASKIASSPVHCEASTVKKPSLQAKAAYCARSRQSNYAASLRLEGYSVKSEDAERKLPTRAAVLKAYQQART